MRIPLAVLTVVTLARPAAADRALIPTDTLSPGTILIGAQLGQQSRRFALGPSGSEQRYRAHSTDTDLSVRLWVASGVSIGVSAASFFARSASVSGDNIELEETSGMDSVQLDSRMVWRFGRFRLGGQLALIAPTSTGRSLQSVRLGAGPIASYDTSPSGEVFAAAGYVGSSGDSFTDVGDRVSASIGYHQRFGRLSLVPKLSVDHLLAQGDGDTSFQTYRVNTTLGAEVRTDLTATAWLELALATQHDVMPETRGGGREIRGGVGIQWAFDASSLQRPAVPEPAALSISVIGNEQAAPELRRQLPALRRATLAAERNAGGADGSVEVLLRLDDAGRVTRVELGGPFHNPAVVKAIRAFYERAQFHATGSVQFTLRFRAFPSPHPPASTSRPASSRVSTMLSSIEQ